MKTFSQVVLSRIVAYLMNCHYRLFSFKTEVQSGQKLVFSCYAGFVYNLKWIDLLSSLLGQGQKTGVGLTILSLSVGHKTTTRCMSKSLAVICTSSMLPWRGIL